MRQGRFAHLIDEDIDYIQGMVDKMWDGVGNPRRGAVQE